MLHYLRSSQDGLVGLQYNRNTYCIRMSVIVYDKNNNKT